MIIKSVRLKNIRSYEDETINFPEGICLLSGDIGSGKSTILFAIEFALFGFSNIKGEGLLRKGKSEGFVELVFDIDGKEIKIRRTILKDKKGVKQNKGYISIDGNDRQLSVEELKKVIFQLLGYDVKSLKKTKDIIFSYTVFTPQEGVKKILLDKADTRLEILRKLFGIYKYKVIRENIVLVRRFIKERKNLLSIKCSDLEENKKKIKEIETTIRDNLNERGKILTIVEKLEKNLAEEKNKEKELKERIKELKILKKNIEDKIKQKDFFEKNIIELKERKKIVAEEIEELKGKVDLTLEGDIINIKEEFNKLSNELKENLIKKAELKGKKEKITENIKEIEEKINRINEEDIKNEENELENLKKKIEIKQDLQENLEKKKKEAEEIKSKILMIESKIKAEKDVIERIEKLSECPLCLQEISVEYKNKIKETKLEELATREKEKEELNNKFKNIEKEINKLNQELELINNLEKDAIKLEEKLKILREAIEEVKYANIKKKDLEKSLEEISATLFSLEKIIKDLENNIKSKEEIIRKIEENNKIKDKIFTLEEKLKSIEEDITKNQEFIYKVKNEIKEAEKKVENIAILEEEEKNINEKISKLEAELIEKKQELARIESELKLNEKQLDELKKIVAKQEGYSVRIKKLNEFEYIVDVWLNNVIAEMEKAVMIKVWHEFNELFREWFNMLMQGTNLNVRLDDSFTPIIEQEGYEISYEYLSGGERTACALAYRLALNKVLNDLIASIKTKDLLILDEPTEGFSYEQLDRFKEILEELNLKQIIIVSHEPRVEAFVDNVLKIVKENGVSRVV